jgi:enoyl-[acyl-carrier protein] reductase II
MAAAFALGAEGVQMGTRMVSAAESPVHDNWKNSIINGAETGTVFLNRLSRPGLRALRTERTTALEKQDHVPLTEMSRALDLYFGGGIEAIKPVQEIIYETIAELRSVISGLASAI